MNRSAALAVMVSMLLARPSSGHAASDDLDAKAWMSAAFAKLTSGSRASPSDMAGLEQQARRRRSLTELQQLLEKRVKLAPEDRVAWGSLARVQALRGSFEEARASMHKAQLTSLAGLPDVQEAFSPGSSQTPPKPPPRTAADFTRLAEERLASGDDLQAQQLFSKALAIDASFAPARLGIGEMHHRQGRRGLAEKAWIELTSRISPRWRGQLTLADVLFSHDMITEAQTTLNAVTAIPQHAAPELWQLRAKVAAKRDDVPAAVKWWTQVIAAAPTEAPAEYARLQLLALVQAAKPAQQKQALDIIGSDTSADVVARSVMLARVQAALNAPDKALALLEAIQAPSDMRVLRAALEVFAAGNRVAEALRWLARFEREAVTVSAAQRATLLLEMSRLERKRGDLQSAEARAEQALGLVSEPRIVREYAAIAELRVAEDAHALTRAEQALANDPQSQRSWAEFLLRHGHLTNLWASGADLSAVPNLLELCSVNDCLLPLEQWCAAEAPPTEEADDLHIAVVARWHRLKASHTIEGAPAWDAVADATVAPLQRTFARASAPGALALQLAGQLQRKELIEPLVHYVPRALIAKQYEQAAFALLSLGSLKALQVFDKSIWEPALQSGADRRVTRAMLWAIGAVHNPGADRKARAAELPSALVRLADSAEGELKPFVLWALRAFADQAVIERLQHTFKDPSQPQVTAAMALDSWLSLRGAGAAADLGFGRDAQLPYLFVTAQASAAEFATGRCTLWHLALRSATPTSEAALGVLLGATEKTAPTLRQLEAWPARQVGAEGPAARAWDGEAVQAAMARDAFWTACRPAAFAKDVDSLSVTRAAIRMAAAWRQQDRVATDAADLAALEKTALWGPACARAPTIYLKDAWGAPVSPLELERALETDEAAACGSSTLVRWLRPAVRRVTSTGGKHRNDVCQCLLTPAAKNGAIRDALRADVVGACP
ncbi:MAG: hypothetical protein SF187_13890 [Deltaproteobacteria bacterium]|nr:hypothetical protein [Deltaproteobacteria bacterium]